MGWIQHFRLEIQFPCQLLKDYNQWLYYTWLKVYIEPI